MFRHGQEIRLGRQDSRGASAEIPVGKAGVELDRSSPGSEGCLQIGRSQGSRFPSAFNYVEPGLIATGVKASGTADANGASQRLATHVNDDGVGRHGEIVDL